MTVAVVEKGFSGGFWDWELYLIYGVWKLGFHIEIYSILPYQKMALLLFHYFQNMYVGFDFLSATLLPLQAPSDFVSAFPLLGEDKNGRV